MPQLNRRTLLLSAVASPFVSRVDASETQSSQDVSPYRVQDPMAGYFDLAERRRVMRDMPSLGIIQARLRAMEYSDCQSGRTVPVQDQTITIPSFYGDNEGWRKAVTPFRNIEDAVSNLAAGNLVSPERGYADCLVDLLLRWARRDALAKFNFSTAYRQGWFQVESTLFAIGHAMAAIRPDILHRKDDLGTIDAWLLRIARSHFAIPGSPGGTCCNNHFYRRALYAAIVGVQTGDDALFQGGVGAIPLALSDSSSEGALLLEMKRGELSAHYQNFALMYLVMIAEIAERQGYPMWDMQIDGKSLHTLVAFNNKVIADPNTVLKYASATEVSLRYQKDMQYFAWFEIYLSRFKNAQMEAWIATRRPMYNRSLGGHLTAYFYVDS